MSRAENMNHASLAAFVNLLDARLDPGNITDVHLRLMVRLTSPS